MPPRNEALSSLLTGAEGGLFHLDDVSEELFVAFGGAKGLAQSIKDEFDAMPAGSPGRERMLMAALQLSVQRNKMGLDEQTDDMGSLDESELERRAEELLKRGAKVE